MTPATAPERTSPIAVAVGGGVHVVDTLYLRPGLAASHIVVDRGRAAFVDTGASPCVPRLLAALDEIGVAREQVDYVFITHVHLDHAGAAGLLMQSLPNARTVIHPRGAPHLVEPSKLIAGSKAVYGEELYAQLYGEIVPIPAERVITTEDRTRIALGGRTFEFFDAPGHAKHHHCPVDLDDRTVYSGDNFGLCYRALDTARGPFMLPTSTPVQFDPPALHATIDRILSYAPRRVCQTHFGPVEDLERLAADLHTAIDEIVAIARRHATAPDRRARIEADMYAFVDARLDAHGCRLDAAGRHAIVDDDIRLNTAGLEVWLDRH